ncbi:hypothetical protein TCDM_12954 [Trypanosoma cruzi Dm28c]|uniref:Uncharacterized protein n=1 Tax=Trypanosoma cruzi Dm28c TaxID=1416333 RepID=V5A497_TRYCR|nr:hypothetical protein TCDM_12954 [Trypanosoma cruzi Dm28c]
MKEKRSLSSHRSSHSHSCYYCYSLSSVPHRHATLTSTSVPPAQVVRDALPLRRNIRHLHPVEQLRVLHFPHNRRHAPATQHTQRHNLVPPLLHNHERNAQRVLAHVLHAPEPPTDQVGRHALHLSVLVVLGTHPHILSIHGLGAARGCRQEQCVWKKQMCGNNGHPHISDISTHSTRPHKRAVSWEREVRRTAHAQKNTQQQRHPRRTATKSLAHIHTNDRNERGAAHPNPRRCSLLLSAATDWHCIPHSQ